MTTRCFFFVLEKLSLEKNTHETHINVVLNSGNREGDGRRRHDGTLVTICHREGQGGRGERGYLHKGREAGGGGGGNDRLTNGIEPPFAAPHGAPHKRNLREREATDFGRGRAFFFSTASSYRRGGREGGRVRHSPRKEGWDGGTEL